MVRHSLDDLALVQQTLCFERGQWIFERRSVVGSGVLAKETSQERAKVLLKKEEDENARVKSKAVGETIKKGREREVGRHKKRDPRNEGKRARQMV